MVSGRTLASQIPGVYRADYLSYLFLPRYNFRFLLSFDFTLNESLSLGTFLRKFWPNVGARMSGGASVPLAFLAIYFENAPLKGLFACLTAFGVLGACYQVWRDSVSSLQKTVAERDAETAKRDIEIGKLDAEIEKLKHRPYDEEHRRLAESKVGGLSEVNKDLVCFLLHYGQTEANELLTRCKVPQEFNVQRARDAGLVVDIRTGNPAQETARYFWKINPLFETVLQDLLGARKTIYF
jgi:hypothetical protein